MTLLLTILSVLALWLLLGALIFMLERIRAPLERINRSLAKIAMGVRAIESETGILKAELPTTASALGQIADGGEGIAARLVSVDSRLAGITQ